MSRQVARWNGSFNRTYPHFPTQRVGAALTLAGAAPPAYSVIRSNDSFNRATFRRAKLSGFRTHPHFPAQGTELCSIEPSGAFSRTDTIYGPLWGQHGMTHLASSVEQLHNDSSSSFRVSVGRFGKGAACREIARPLATFSGNFPSGTFIHHTTVRRPRNLGPSRRARFRLTNTWGVGLGSADLTGNLGLGLNNRGRDKSERRRAESQRIVAARPLCLLQYPVAYLSRLQRIQPADRWKFNFMAAGAASPPRLLRQRHVPLGAGGPLLLVGKRTAGACVASSPDSDLEAFSHNPAHGSFAPLAFQPSAMTNCANQRFLSY